MTYKLHGDFTEQARKAIRERIPGIKEAIQNGILSDMIYLSRMGLLPEGASAAEQRRVNMPGGPPLTQTVAQQMESVGVERFSFGTLSNSRLEVVHPKLRQCAEIAIGISRVDFRVNETQRSTAAQKVNVAKGASRTMKSKHFKQPDGWVWAMDLVALDEHSTVTWDEDSYAEIAFAMDQAATQLGIAGHVRWGAAWDRVLSDFEGVAEHYLNEAREYAARFRAHNPGKAALTDMPHFEWVA